MTLEVKDLSYSYGDREILHDISFRAEPGEFVSILGSNGVGKSTLFKCILSLLGVRSGDVLLDGKSTRTMSVGELAKCIAYIPQSTSPAFNYSVEDIVLMGTTSGLGAFATPGGEQLRRAGEALDRIGITQLRNRCFHHLSGGERQLVIIARALAQNAKILLLDEPTASLDLGNQLKVLRSAKGLAAEGYTIIQTTHNPEHSYMFSDRIVALKAGRVLKDGTPGAVITDSTMTELYGTGIKVASLENDSVRVCLPSGDI